MSSFISLSLSADWNTSLEFKLILTDTITGDPVNLSTATEIWFTGKQNMFDADGAAVFQVKKTTGGIVVGGVSNNEMTVRVNNVASSLVNSNVKLYVDAKVKLSDNFAQVVAKGTLQVSQSVTQS